MKKILIIIVSALMLTSCLKDKEYDNGEIGHQVLDQNIIELIHPNSTETVKVMALDFKNLDTVLSLVSARISSATPAPSDITITLDTTVTYSYDTSHSDVEHFKKSLGTIVSPLTLTIPKGSKESQPIQIKVNTANFDPSSRYVVGFKVKSVSNSNYLINANYNTYYVILSAKNAYDGLYEISGTCVDANGVYTGYYPGSLYFDPSDPRKYSLTTISAVSGLFYDEWFPYTNYIVQNISTGGFANTGIKPVITFDPATNKVVSVTNYNNATQVFTVGSNSKFNPGDHSIDVQWTLGRWAVTEHWKYIGPR